MIYIDLDETLVSQDLYANEAHLTVLRPGVIDFLTELRRSFRFIYTADPQPIHLLSAGMNAYVRQNNVLHKLGFPIDNIIGRESLYKAEFDQDYNSIEVPIKKDVCPHAVLLENQPIENSLTKIKMAYLGIKPEQVIVVPHFFYHPDRKDSYFIDNKKELIDKIMETLRNSHK